MYIQNNYLKLYSQIYPKQQFNNPSANKCPEKATRRELPCVYYQPNFTSNDESFKKNLEYVKNLLEAADKKRIPIIQNNMVYDGITTDNIIKNLDKHTINCAITILKKTPQKYLIESNYIPSLLMVINKDNVALANIMNLYPNTCMGDKWDNIKILKYTNEENIDFAKEIIRHGFLHSDETIDLLKSVNKETIPFLRFTYKEMPCLIFDEIINAYKHNDKIQGLCWVLDYYKRNDEEFPNDVVNLVRTQIDSDTLKIIKEFYNNNVFGITNKNEIADIIGSIRASNMPFFKHIVKHPDKLKNSDRGSVQYLLDSITSVNSDFAIELYNNKKEDFSFYDISLPLRLSAESPKSINVIKKLYYNKKISNQIIKHLISQTANEIPNYIDEKSDINKLVDRAKRIENICYKNPKMFINGQNDNLIEQDMQLSYFFENNFHRLMVAAAIFDDETLDVIMHKRFAEAQKYLCLISNFCLEDYKLLEKMLSSKNINNKKFSPTEKIDFALLIQCYNENIIPTSIIKEHIQDGEFDVRAVKSELLNILMRNIGFTDSEIATIPKDKLRLWEENINYIHYLTMQITEKDSPDVLDVIRESTFNDFNKYIHGNNIYGETNRNTKLEMESMGINYENWLHPNPENNVHFVTKDRNAEELRQIADLILDDIEDLRTTPAKNYIDKKFPKYINDKNMFVIPDNVRKNKYELEKFTGQLITELKKVWERAEKNLNNTDTRIANRAANTITILDHINQRINDIQQVKTAKLEKNLDYTIKMWDRIPQKDLFQGNYSTCCIGMGNFNGEAMARYLLNTAFNMIEIKDNNTGKIIGNALCYLVKDDYYNPAIVIDNIEINNTARLGNRNALKLRMAIAKYADNVAKDITGRNDIHIYMSDKYNDIPTDDLKRGRLNLGFIGDLTFESNYLDLYKGWTDTNSLDKALNVLILK